jgi:hypothetical protein
MNVEIKCLHDVGSSSKSKAGRQDGLTSLILFMILRRAKTIYTKPKQTTGSFSHDTVMTLIVTITNKKT